MRVLTSFGWQVAVEVSFARSGERGSIDVLAWHPVRRRVLVIEVKSVAADLQATLVGVDRKGRLGPVDRGGTRLAGGGRIAIARLVEHVHEPTPGGGACRDDCGEPPASTREVTAWLRDPVEPSSPASGSCQMPTG